MEKEKSVTDNATVNATDESLSSKRISSIAGDELPKYEWDVILTKDVKEAGLRLKEKDSDICICPEFEQFCIAFAHAPTSRLEKYIYWSKQKAQKNKDEIFGEKLSK